MNMSQKYLEEKKSKNIIQLYKIKHSLKEAIFKQSQYFCKFFSNIFCQLGTFFRKKRGKMNVGLRIAVEIALESLGSFPNIAFSWLFCWW